MALNFSAPQKTFLLPRVAEKSGRYFTGWSTIDEWAQAITAAVGDFDLGKSLDSYVRKAGEAAFQAVSSGTKCRWGLPETLRWRRSGTFTWAMSSDSVAGVAEGVKLCDDPLVHHTASPLQAVVRLWELGEVDEQAVQSVAMELGPGEWQPLLEDGAIRGLFSRKTAARMKALIT